MTRWGPEEQTVLERHCGNVKTNVFLLFQEDTFILSFNTCFFFFFVPLHNWHVLLMQHER